MKKGKREERERKGEREEKRKQGYIFICCTIHFSSILIDCSVTSWGLHDFLVSTKPSKIIY